MQGRTHLKHRQVHWLPHVQQQQPRPQPTAWHMLRLPMRPLQQMGRRPPPRSLLSATTTTSLSRILS